MRARAHTRTKVRTCAHAHAQSLSPAHLQLRNDVCGLLGAALPGAGHARDLGPRGLGHQLGGRGRGGSCAGCKRAGGGLPLVHWAARAGRVLRAPSLRLPYIRDACRVMMYTCMNPQVCAVLVQARENAPLPPPPHTSRPSSGCCQTPHPAHLPGGSGPRAAAQAPRRGRLAHWPVGPASTAAAGAPSWPRRGAQRRGRRWSGCPHRRCRSGPGQGCRRGRGRCSCSLARC